jgi:hypothetical protein
MPLNSRFTALPACTKWQPQLVTAHACQSPEFGHCLLLVCWHVAALCHMIRGSANSIPQRLLHLNIARTKPSADCLSPTIYVQEHQTTVLLHRRRPCICIAAGLRRLCCRCIAASTIAGRSSLHTAPAAVRQPCYCRRTLGNNKQAA